MTEDRRYRPDDGCPLFSERLEEHLVAVSRGEQPNRGRFCGHCYTPMSPESVACRHCDEPTGNGRPPVDQVPAAIVQMLADQRRTERTWVTGFAYLGVLIAVVAGLGVVLGVPVLRENLLPAAIVYGAILLVGSRVAAGLLGGYYGDRIGYERARRGLLTRWARWVEERDPGAAQPPPAASR